MKRKQRAGEKKQARHYAWPLAFTFPYYFRASGSAAFTLVISIVSIWIFRVGLAHVFILVLHMSVLGIWYAMFIDWIFRILIFAIHYRRHYTWYSAFIIPMLCAAHDPACAAHL